MESSLQVGLATLGESTITLVLLFPDRRILGFIRDRFLGAAQDFARLGDILQLAERDILHDGIA